MKQIPNILSISRIFLSLLLLFFFKIPLVFMIFYLLIGITDFLDGFIARKYNAESVVGAKLDSIGDFFFYIILSAYLIIEQREVIFPFLIPVLLIFIFRFGNIVIGFIKYKKLIMIHTFANKLTGLLLFILPIMIILGVEEFLFIAVIVALLSPIEELIILLRSPKEKIDLNKRSIFII